MRTSFKTSFIRQSTKVTKEPDANDTHREKGVDALREMLDRNRRTYMPSGEPRVAPQQPDKDRLRPFDLKGFL
jgi:hypothetical protein